MATENLSALQRHAFTRAACWELEGVAAALGTYIRALECERGDEFETEVFLHAFQRKIEWIASAVGMLGGDELAEGSINSIRLRLQYAERAERELAKAEAAHG